MLFTVSSLHNHTLVLCRSHSLRFLLSLDSEDSAKSRHVASNDDVFVFVCFVSVYFDISMRIRGKNESSI